MNDNPTWQVAHLDDIERRGRDIPVREHLGIHAFGINAYTPGEDGTLINEHDESGSGQEELYIVLDGKATFEVDGETVDAPAGTLVFVGPESRRKATGDGTVLAVGATPGEAYQGIDWGEAWPFHRESMTAYGEQRYADALEAVRGALEHMPDHAGLHYNYACFATLAGDTGDDTFAHLRRSVELLPRFREDARRDDDLAGPVGHCDGGLIVNRVRRHLPAGGPLFCVGHRVLRQVLVIQVRKHRKADHPQRFIATGGRLPPDEVLSDVGGHHDAPGAQSHVDRAQRRQEVRQSGLPHPVAQIQGIAAIHQQDVRLLDHGDPLLFIDAGQR